MKFSDFFNGTVESIVGCVIYALAVRYAPKIWQRYQAWYAKQSIERAKARISKLEKRAEFAKKLTDRELIIQGFSFLCYTIASVGAFLLILLPSSIRNHENPWEVLVFVGLAGTGLGIVGFNLFQKYRQIEIEKAEKEIIDIRRRIGGS